MKRAIPFFVLWLLLMAGCDNSQRTVDSLRREIAEFKADPNDARQAAIEKSFAKLDEQIAVVRKRGETIKATELDRQASNLRGDFQAAKMARAMQDAQKAIQGFGEALKNTGKNLQEAFRSTNSEDKE